eukprot:4064460-Amphidinium_carterae.1
MPFACLHAAQQCGEGTVLVESRSGSHHLRAHPLEGRAENSGPLRQATSVSRKHKAEQVPTILGH